MKKVHLIFDAEIIEGLAESLKEFAIITGKDFSLDTAAHWALSGKGETPDIIFIDGTVDVSKVDVNSGKITRDKLFISRLKDIRISRPESQVILLLPEDRAQDLNFLQAITSLAIFDIYFVSTFNEESLQQWFETKKSIADVQQMLPGTSLEDSELSLKKNTYREEEEPVKSGLLGKFFGPRNKQNRDDDTPLEDESKQGKQTEETLSPKQATRIRSGRPVVVLGLGSQNLNEWFNNTFSDKVEVAAETSSQEEMRQAIQEKKPDVIILMRNGPMGGIPEAETIAETAVEHVPAVLFIAGEVDDEGKEIVDRLKSLGIKHILSCPKGGFISGDELVFMMYNIIREIRNSNEIEEEINDEEPAERTDTIKILKGGAERLTQIFKQATSTEKKLKRTIKKLDSGIALEEKPVVEIFNDNIKNPTAIVPGGVFVIVSPWRPGLAGRLAAQAVKLFSEVEGGEVAYIGASKLSTGALWLDIPEDELMMSDWRVPGSQCPIKKDNLSIYAIDPAKDLKPESENETWAILKEARKTATYTVMDLGGDIDTAQKAAHQGRVVILVILPGADPVELKISQLWLRNLQEGKKKVIVGIDVRGCPPILPEGIKPKVFVRNNPADALSMALRRNKDDEFIWN